MTSSRLQKDGGTGLCVHARLPRVMGSRLPRLGIQNPVPRRRQQSGFTLIELIVSITLVSTIAVGMMIAMRGGLLTLERTSARMDENRRAVGIQEAVRRQLGGAMPVRGNCADAVRQPIFRGNAQGLLMVTSYSLTEGFRGYPRIVQYQVVPAPNGMQQLIANEYLYSGPASSSPFCSPAGLLPAAPTPQSLVIADNLASARILYQRFDLTGLGSEWLGEWTSNVLLLPAAIRIEVVPAASASTRAADAWTFA